MAPLRPGIQSAFHTPRKLNDVRLGETGQLSRVFGAEQVAEFARLVGDDNPIHFDEEYAAATMFGRCIVHGPLYSGLVGTVLGTVCPGPGTILVEQTYRFLRPVFVGEEVTARVTVREIDERSSIHLDIECQNGQGDTVLRGSAVTRLAR